MWRKFKTFILNLFTEKIDEDETESSEELASSQTERTSFRNQSIKRRQIDIPEVRMKYQYPEERLFRFPVIPDEKNEFSRNQRKRRSTQKSVRNDYNRKDSHPIQESAPRSERLEPIFVRKNVEVNRGLIKKTSNQPFRPTEVPSPIYGYQPRNSNNIHTNEDLEKPAYLRRKNKQKSVDEQKNTSDSLEAKISTTTEKIEQIADESAMSEQTSFIVLEETENQRTERTKEPKEKQNPVQKDIKQPGLDIFEAQGEQLTEEAADDQTPFTPEDAVSALYKNINQFAEMEKENKEIPYNVIMTGKDYGLTPTKEGSKIAKKDTRLDEAEKIKQTRLSTNDEAVDKDIPLHLLDDLDDDEQTDESWIQEQRYLLEETLRHFNVEAEVVHATKGPSVTRFEVQPELGVKVSRVRNLSDDLKLNMAAKDIRIEAPIPGKNAIGIEIPNKKSRTVRLEEILSSDAFQNSISPLTVGLGLNIEGEAVITDINAMPHGLIAGATGSGKSVCINTILVSLLYKANYNEVKFLLIDPKMVELAAYNGIPHLVSPVITDIKAATAALKWAVEEMESRYEKFVAHSVRDITRYNEKMTKENAGQDKMPYLVIVIDELADLMMMAPQDVEDAICRIAQKARACGIHLLIATQRPSVDVITGLIKANIPTRIAFSVSQQVDSRTILDTGGAERLLGKGDMLFVENGAGNIARIQGAFVSDEEIERITSYARTIAEPNYLFEQEQLLQQIEADEDMDELLYEVIDFIIEENQASTSSLQRRFRIGYNRAARLMDTLEKMGIINKQNGSRPRDVLMTRAQIEEVL